MVATISILCYDREVHIFGRIFLKIAANAGILYAAKIYTHGIEVTGGPYTLLIIAMVLALLNTFLKPVLRLITTPLRWITFGLFNIVISLAILGIADQLLVSLAITDTTTFFWLSIAIGFVNAII
mgnify:CR=1 FL=1